MLLDIDFHLSKNDIKRLVYLLGPHISKKEDEQICDGIDLFRILEEKGLISESNVDLVIWLLEKIRRKDLARTVREYNEKGIYNGNIPRELKTDGEDLSKLEKSHTSTNNLESSEENQVISLRHSNDASHFTKKSEDQASRTRKNIPCCAYVMFIFLQVQIIIIILFLIYTRLY